MNNGQKRVALFHAIQMMQAFAGQPMRHLDIADNLEKEDFVALQRIASRVALGAIKLEQTISEEQTVVNETWQDGLNACRRIQAAMEKHGDKIAEAIEQE